MPTQLTLEDFAEQRRDTGIARASASSGGDWKEYALAFLECYLRIHSTLFVDDLWAAGLEEPQSPRALGAVIKTAQARHWIEELRRGDLILAKPSTRSNMQLKRVWKSRLHTPHLPTTTPEGRGA